MMRSEELTGVPVSAATLATISSATIIRRNCRHLHVESPPRVSPQLIAQGLAAALKMSGMLPGLNDHEHACLPSSYSAGLRRAGMQGVWLLAANHALPRGALAIDATEDEWNGRAPKQNHP